MTTTAEATLDRTPLPTRIFRQLGIGFVYAGSALPLLALANFYGFVLRARLVSGAWPSYANGPDHTSFGFGIQEQLIAASYGLPLVFVSWFVSAAGLAWLTPDWVSRHRFILLLSSWFIPIGVAIIDPGSFVHWYLFFSN